METLQLDELNIYQLVIKTSAKSGDNQGKAHFSAQMTTDIAKELKCYDSVYAKDGLPITNFKGHSLKFKMESVRLDFSPIAGTGFALDAAKLDNFSIYPSESGLEIAFSAKLLKNLSKFTTFYNTQGASPLTVVITQLQTEMFDKDGNPIKENPQVDRQKVYKAKEDMPKRTKTEAKSKTKAKVKKAAASEE